MKVIERFINIGPSLFHLCSEAEVLYPQNLPLVCHFSIMTPVCPASKESKQSPALAWSSWSSIRGLQGEGRGIRYSEQACCNASVRAVKAANH